MISRSLKEAIFSYRNHGSIKKTIRYFFLLMGTYRLAKKWGIELPYRYDVPVGVFGDMEEVVQFSKK